MHNINHALKLITQVNKSELGYYGLLFEKIKGLRIYAK